MSARNVSFTTYNYNHAINFDNTAPEEDTCRRTLLAPELYIFLMT